jgi:DNA-binding CsgD family transcriptional regulator
MKGSGTAVAELLERERESAQLSARIDAALAGEGSIVALEGEAGIGKSALLAYAAEHAATAGMRVLSARGGELEQDFGYGVVRQLFDPALSRMPTDECDRVLSGAAGLALSALSVPDRSAERATDPGSVLHGLYWLTANIVAEQPVLVALDDAHWADSASIAFLAYLARRVDGLALLIVYATRIGEGSSDALPATAEPGFAGTVMRPAVLSESATVALINRLLGGESSAEFAHACRVATGGNPFLLQELLRALQADGVAPDEAGCKRVTHIAPSAISRATLARLRRLGDAATRLAFATAVLGKSAELRHAAALAKLDPEAAGEAADALTAAAILRDGRPLEFIHPVVRTTVYGEIPVAQRAASHKRAARLLAGDSVGPAELAPHLMACEPAGDVDVVECLRVAANDVRDRGATDAACTYLSRALAEPPAPEDRAEVLYELGTAEFTGGWPDASRHLREALAGKLDPRVQRAAAVDFVLTVVATGEIVDALKLLDESRASTVANGEVEAALQLDGILAGIAQLNPTTTAPVRARLATYEGRLGGATVGERLVLGALAYDAAHRLVPAAHAVGLAELAVADGRLLFEQPPHAPNFPLAVWTLFYAERLERADELYTMAVERARDQGSLVSFAIASSCRCQVRFCQGRIAEAEAEARTCLEAAGHAYGLGRHMLIASVLDAMVERSTIEACHAFLAEQGVGEDLGEIAMASRLLYSRGHLRLTAGDPAGALRDFAQIRERDELAGRDLSAVPTRASAAVAHWQLGEVQIARELASDQLERSRVWGAPGSLSFALRAAGMIRGGEEGLELLREAAAVGDGCEARYEYARSLAEYGAALRRAGRRRDAREPLRAALELADRCGALRTAARAREELLATGARPRRAARSGADSLTPSERRVSRLATEGLSNREIAQALFVTVRTVEGHLTQAYMKLDIASREQLADALQSPAA